jgi:hypothetical protein
LRFSSESNSKNVIERAALSIGMCRVGVSEPSGPATIPHASSGWSRRACATIASRIPASMLSTRPAYPNANDRQP